MRFGTATMVFLATLVGAAAVQAVNIAPAGSLMRREMKRRTVPTVTTNQGCTEDNVEMYYVLGTWCQGSCMPPTSAMAVGLGLQSDSSCIEKGYTAYNRDIEAHLFVPNASELKNEASETFTIGNHATLEECNMHHVLNNGVCESFCVGADGEFDNAAFAEQHAGVVEGSCSTSTYPKYVGKYFMKVYFKRSIARVGKPSSDLRRRRYGR